MQAFQSLAYLDVEKTGTAFVNRFLREHLDEPELDYRRHGLLEAHPPTNRLHVISVRNPVDQYLSLFSYGCDSRGEFWKVMAEQGFGRLYEPTSAAFGRWIDFVLDPANARYIPNRNYLASGVAPYIGMMSFRVVRLAIPQPVRNLKAATSYEDVRRIYQDLSVVDFVVHTETLAADLERLVSERSGDLSWKPSPAEAIEALRGARRRNVSQRVDERSGFVVPSEAASHIRERERLLYEEFGYS